MQCGAGLLDSSEMQAALLATLLLLLPAARAAHCDDALDIESEGPGSLQALLRLGPVNTSLSGWTAALTFSAPVDRLECVMAEPSGAGLGIIHAIPFY